MNIFFDFKHKIKKNKHGGCMEQDWQHFSHHHYGHDKILFFEIIYAIVFLSFRLYHHHHSC